MIVMKGPKFRKRGAWNVKTPLWKEAKQTNKQKKNKTKRETQKALMATGRAKKKRRKLEPLDILNKIRTELL